MKLTINVTQNRIDHGQREQEVSCPVALAFKGHRIVRRANVGRRMVTLTLNRLLGTYAYERVELRLPDEVSNWIESYDCGEPVQPIIFVVELDNVWS